MKKPTSFGWLNATQFFGALNDNVFKLLIMFCLIGMAPESKSTIVAIVGAVFVVPFLLLSHVGGAIADKWSRRNIIVATKIAEVAVMVLGLIAFFLNNAVCLYVVCFLMSSQSALFGPSKYGIVPQLVPEDRLAKANGVLLCFTFLAVIVGTTLAAVLSWLVESNYPFAAFFCIMLATLGTLSAISIKKTPRAEPSESDVSPLSFKAVAQTFGAVKHDTYLILTVISTGYFIMTAAFMQLNLIPYGMDSLELGRELSGCLFLIAALGIGVGSLVTGRLSGRNIEFGLVPIGAAGLTLSCLLLAVEPSIWVCFVSIFLGGMSIGFFTVPLETFLQLRSPKEKLGKVLAASNLAFYSGALMAAVLIYIISSSSLLNCSAAQAFLIIGLVNIALVAGTILVLPDFLIRFLVIMLTRVVYRIRTVGIENIPISGGALLICNHVTLVDSLLLSATQQRRIRFMLFRETYEKSPFKPLFKLMRVIPISFQDSPKQMVGSFRKARKMLDDGYLVCIFAEGMLTRNGKLSPFKPGFQKIVKKSGHPIIPIYIGGTWGSMFSYRHGRPLPTVPSELPFPVTVVFGRTMPPESGAAELRQAACELSSEYFESKKHGQESLPSLFIRSARAHWSRHAVSDTTGKRLSYGKALIAATALAGVVKKMCRDQDKIGVILPATAGAALINIAIAMLGKVSVNLNFTASKESIVSAVQQCNIKTTFSSKAFIEKLGDFEMPEGTVYLEDIAPKISGAAKLIALLKAVFLPCKALTNGRNFDPDNIATIIFSSGSTGEPKGVMLSHHNVISNMDSFGMAFSFTAKDNMCGALPFFHSFGFTCTLWFPLVTGFSVVYHPNPLDGGKIAEVVRENGSTILLATPTFLLAYIRRAKPEDFVSLRYVITGAEKLRQRVAASFEKRFGLAPLEGYGTTELSPVVSVNVPDIIEGNRVIQEGTRKGTIGQAIPGVTMKIVDFDTWETLPTGEEGLLVVKGPNVMVGYLGKPEKTAEVIRDGWYDTGDIAKIDAEGFVTITDRASRFSKIGGEMVPHIAIEEAYLKTLASTDRLIVVTSVPDEKRGEKLVVLFVKEAGTAEDLHRIISESDVPNLWKPRLEDHIEVEAIPILGSGKLDLKGVKKMAAEAIAQRP